MTYEISYVFQGIKKSFDIEAASETEARRLSRLEHNPTLQVTQMDRPAPGVKKVFHQPAVFEAPKTLVNFLKVNEQSVHIRLHWGQLCDTEARKTFEKLGITKETDLIRPLENEQYGISGTVQFPEPPNFLMQEIKKFDLTLRPMGDGILETHSASFALSLIQAGFKADRSARY